MMCNRLAIKGTKSQQSGANRFFSCSKKLPGGANLPPPSPSCKLGLKSKVFLEGFDETHAEELLDQVHNHKETLTEKLETLKVLGEAIVELVKDKEIDTEIEESENFKFGIHDIMRKIYSKLKRLKKSEASTGEFPLKQRGFSLPLCKLSCQR